MAGPHVTEGAQLKRLAEKQAALRRVATMVARGEPAGNVFAAVAQEVARVLHVSLVSIARYEDDSTATECASFSEQGELFPVGARWSLAGTNVLAKVRMSGRPARIDNYTGLEGQIVEEVRRVGIRSTVGIPIVVDGLLWGATVVSSAEAEPLPAETEAELADFTELVATAISNTEARSEVERLAEDQAALRRVATLVAGGVPPQELFAAVAREVGMLVGGDTTHVGRYEAEGTVRLIAGWARAGDQTPTGTVTLIDGQNVCSLVVQTGRPARMNSYDDASGPIAAMLRGLGIRSSVGAPIVVDGRHWGVTIVSSKRDEPLPVATEARIAAFTELLATAISNSQARAEVARLADEQAALRRVATLVAEAVQPGELFGAVTEEVGRLLGADLAGMIRYESGDAVSPIAAWAAGGEHPDLPDRWPTEEGDPAKLIAETLRPARIDDWQGVPGPIAAYIRDELGISSSVGSPIIVEGRLWGALAVHSKQPEPLPPDTESRLLDFTELVATAMSNAQARAEAHRLADEQAALRRVATLVARESPPREIFAAVAEEAGRHLGVGNTALFRYENDGTVTIVAGWGEFAAPVPLGARLSLGGENVTSMVQRTGRPARLDDYAKATGSLGATSTELGVGAAVGTPVVVDGRLWGAMVAASVEPLPTGAEARLEGFSELVATAISNVQVRSDLAASRARIVAASDEERRRLVRNLHDGAQQRLVHTVITLKLARRALEEDDDAAPTLVAGALDQAAQTAVEVRELSHGILPAVLTRGGLRAGVEALASRMSVPVEIDMSIERLPAAVEGTGYFVVAEALTNVAKHSGAEHAEVTARTEDGTLRVEVRDDGVGGARRDGSGLLGLGDRLAAVDGRLRVDSPPGGGTVVAAAIPIQGMAP